MSVGIFINKMSNFMYSAYMFSFKYYYDFSTYNKQWAEAQSALMDLLVQEMPAEPPKPERVS